MPDPRSANTMSPLAYNLDGFQWPVNTNFMAPDDATYLLLSSPKYCSPNTNRAIGKELKNLANVLRVCTNLRIIFEGVVHFAEFWGAKGFWDCLLTSLYPKSSFKAATLESVVTQYCTARKAFHRDHQDRYGRIAPLDNAPSVIASLVDKVIHTTAFPLKAHLVVPTLAWATRESSWPAKLASILQIISPGCRAANKSTANLTKKSLAKLSKGSLDNHRSGDSARFEIIKTGKDTFIAAVTSAINAIARTPLTGHKQDIESKSEGRHNEETASGSHAGIVHENESMYRVSLEDEDNFRSPPAVNTQRDQSLKRKANSPADNPGAKRRSLESFRNASRNPLQKSLEIRTTSSKLESAKLTVEDESRNSVARAGTPTTKFATRENENISCKTGEDEVRVVKDAKFGSLIETTVGGSTDTDRPSINQMARINVPKMQQDSRNGIQGIKDSSCAVETTGFDYGSSIRREESPNMTLLEDDGQNDENSVKSQNLSLARLDARLHSHEKKISVLREELVTHMSKEDLLKPLLQLPERFIQLECNVQRIDNIEAQLQHIQSQMRSGTTLTSSPALSSINAAYSKADIALPVGSKHLQYLKKCSPRQFLDGIGDEINKIRVALQVKIKEQDETDQGWKIMGHFGEVLWALDKAVKKAETGAQEL